MPRSLWSERRKICNSQRTGQSESLEQPTHRVTSPVDPPARKRGIYPVHECITFHTRTDARRSTHHAEQPPPRRIPHPQAAAQRLRRRAGPPPVVVRRGRARSRPRPPGRGTADEDARRGQVVEEARRHASEEARRHVSEEARRHGGRGVAICRQGQEHENGLGGPPCCGALNRHVSRTCADSAWHDGRMDVASGVLFCSDMYAYLLGAIFLPHPALLLSFISLHPDVAVIWMSDI